MHTRTFNFPQAQRHFIPLTIALLLAANSSSVLGGVIIAVEDKQISTSDIDPAFEVILQVDSGTPTLSSYNLGLIVTSETVGFDLDFAGVLEPVDHTPIFRGSIPQVFPNPNDDVLFVADNLDSGSVAIFGGAGLIRVSFNLLPNIEDGTTFEVSIDPNSTFLFTSSGGGQVEEVPIEVLQAGTITVVPEPGTFSLMAVALVAMITGKRYRSGRSNLGKSA